MNVCNVIASILINAELMDWFVSNNAIDEHHFTSLPECFSYKIKNYLCPSQNVLAPYLSFIVDAVYDESV